MKRLSELAALIPGAVVLGAADTRVAGVATHSQAVQPGDLFVAIRGFADDGARYVREAVERGAAAAVTEPVEISWSVPTLVVPETRRALAVLAAAVFDRPSQRIGMIGVTGTDGKSTTVRMIASVLAGAGLPTDFLSTVEHQSNGRVVPNPTPNTTPDAVTIQRWLAGVAAGGARFAVLEVSSHALALNRVDGCEFDAAVCTNLSREHLNFHGSFTRYVLDKARLFRHLDHAAKTGIPRIAVVNGDDPTSEWLVASTPPDVRIIRYGFEPGNDVLATAQTYDSGGTRFRLSTPRGEITMRSATIGRHNVANWLAAAAVCDGLAVPLEAIAVAAEVFQGVPGRLQRIIEGQPFHVFVDFAHTPAALSAALDALDALKPRRRIVVFGHAGGRDRKNRPELGRVAIRRSDLAIITTDDPGYEDPLSIAAEIAAGAEAAGGRAGNDYVVVIDRAVAIAHAIEAAEAGDAVLIAGRGHERVMPVGAIRLPFDDAEVVRSLLRARGYRPVPPTARPERRGA